MRSPSRSMWARARSLRLCQRYVQPRGGALGSSLTLLQVNPDIRGGLIVEIGDRTIDLSVSSKMARMNKLLKDTL